MKTLVSLQEETVAALLALPPLGRRSAFYGISFLNRMPRSLRKIRHQYEQASARLGWNAEQIAQQWSDVKDIALLEAACE